MTAAEAAVAACARELGLAFDEPVTVRGLTNTLVRLAPSAVLARVATSPDAGDGPERIDRELTVLAFLHDRGTPVVAPAEGLPLRAHERDGFRFVFLRFYEQLGRPSQLEAGRALRRVHDTLLDYAGELPALQLLLDRVDALIAGSALDELSAADRELCLSVHERVSAGFTSAAWEPRPLHGDAHLENVMQTAEGPLWHDFESTCLGPLEYDLCWFGLAVRSAYPPLDEQLLALCLAHRVLGSLLWAAPRLGEDDHVRAEADRCLRFLRERCSSD